MIRNDKSQAKFCYWQPLMMHEIGIEFCSTRLHYSFDAKYLNLNLKSNTLIFISLNIWLSIFDYQYLVQCSMFQAAIFLLLGWGHPVDICQLCTIVKTRSTKSVMMPSCFHCFVVVVVWGVLLKWQLVLHQGSVTRRVDISIISSLRRNFCRASTAYTLCSTAPPNILYYLCRE